MNRRGFFSVIAGAFVAPCIEPAVPTFEFKEYRGVVEIPWTAVANPATAQRLTFMGKPLRVDAACKRDTVYLLNPDLFPR